MLNTPFCGAIPPTKSATFFFNCAIPQVSFDSIVLGNARFGEVRRIFVFGEVGKKSRLNGRAS